ncbi:Connector enhancer of kinase suppressor of ras 1 [Clonorchis sinensis]|uniref:Connector enhancer of kinase suppressor of ras 1 n=1 Tax=Clonorchis sinensis TaxID=79923 RepID=A0A8T1M0E0_CLOSI|nr:Connector enhancer of kinase suppressor of ras 1 [Clonorchis sinensis]
MGSVDSMPKQVVGLTHRSKSFKDLVPAESNGWLWLKRSNTLLSKYGKRWCVFKNSTLYYYRHVEDQVAEGIINMNGFTVTPAPEVKYGRYPFYVHNDWIRFIFAAETETDRTKWMNLLTMPSIALPDINENRSPRVGGFGPGHLTGDEDLPPRVSLRSKATIVHSEHDSQLRKQTISSKPGQDAERLRTSANQSPLELRRNPSLGVKPLSPCVSREDETDPSASSFIVPKIVPQVFCSLPHRSPSVPSGLSYMDGGGCRDFDEPLMGCPRMARVEASPIIVRDLKNTREKPSSESHPDTHSPTYMLPPQSPQCSSTSKSPPPISDVTSGRPNSHRYQLTPPVRDSRQRAMSSSPLPQCHRKRSALVTSNNDHPTTPTSGV